MADYYMDKIQRLENTCNSWIQRADQCFIDNNCKHSKEECQYLQRAINVRSEMANLSFGVEREYQNRRMRELNKRLNEAIFAIDPEFFKRKSEEKKTGRSKPKGEGSGAAASSGNVSDPSDETVNGWFKDVPSHSFADVTGMEDVKKKLKACMEDAKLEKIKDYLGIRKQKSYFFVGPPGCGKTYIIEAFAHEFADSDCKYLSLNSADILSRYVGDAEKIVTKLFEVAEDNAPCIVFIDEIDGVCKNRSLPNLPEYAASITTAFLTGYNRIKNSNKRIIFLGATNYPALVDSAMLDRVELINIPFPDKKGRIMKFQRELGGKINLTDGFSYDEIGELTDKTVYNYRDIERLCEELKNHVMSEVISRYRSEDKAIEALKSGEFGINKELYLAVSGKCRPTPKDSIIEQLEEWNKKYEEGEFDGEL